MSQESPKKRQKKRTLKIRKFLNKDIGLSAHIIAEADQFTITTNKNGSKGFYGYPNLNISDCYRKISLDLAVDTKSYNGVMHKLHTVRDTVDQLIKFLDNEYKIFQETKDDTTE